jgi:hypothetical protein
MNKLMDSMGEKEDKAAEDKIADYMKQLGADFDTASKTLDSVDDATDDGKALYAVVDDISGKCPQ